MFQIDSTGTAASLPSPLSTGITPGYFAQTTNPLIVPTVVSADFLNMQMVEICNVVTGAGLTLSKSTYNQLFLAVQSMPRKGTTTNDNAAAGFIGEYISSTIASGSAVSLSTSLSTHTITSISLTAGDWDVRGIVCFTYGVASVTGVLAAVGLVTNAFPDTASVGATNACGAFPALASAPPLSTGVARFSLASTTTVFLTAAGQYTGGTPTAYGQISARRVR